MEVSAGQLKQAVESQHGGTSTLVAKLSVKETFVGKTIWEGTVHIFDLDDHPSATTTYAWSSSVEGGNERRFAVLHLGGLRGLWRPCGRLSWPNSGRRPENASHAW